MASLTEQLIGDIQNAKQKKRNKATGDKQAIPNNVPFPGNSKGFVELKVSEVYTNQKIDNVEFENPLHTSPEVFDAINKYRGVLVNAISVGQGPPGLTGKKTKTKNTQGEDIERATENAKEIHRIIYETISSPSLFNPYYGVQAAGITSGIPLLDTQTSQDVIKAKTNRINATTTEIVKHVNVGVNIDDCSIANLVALSKRKFSSLGHAKYKYTDFMYCLEVGKISNNHLITLRRFNYPIGDNIFGETTLDDESNMSVVGEIGRLITWFGTEDNKLEDILHYSYGATWKTLEAKIQELPSQETASERGVMGGLVNLFNPDYNKATERGIAPSALSLILGTGGSDAFLDSAPYADNPAVNGSCYDKNKVYEPQDTLRSMEVPEGKLEFSHEFTLVFNYKLRGYENINAKSALLDLLANILVVTYKTGTFWPGEQRIIGAPPSPSGWQKVEAFKEDAFAAGGTFIQKMLAGDSFSDAANSLLSGLSDAINSNFGIDLGSISSFSDLANVAKGIIDKAGKAGFGGALKGMIGNQLGRPAVYAFDSLLTGDNTGLWHVTIGNPLNPIAVMGNLIMTNAEISHSGPLGLDDFPTDLKVTVTLKHARPRDSVDIQRMYTWGRSAIYGKIGADANFKYPFGTDSEKTEKKSEETSVVTEFLTIPLLNAIPAETSDAYGWIGEVNKTRFRKGNVDSMK